MSILQKKFEQMLAESTDYASLKNNFAVLTDSINELAKSTVSITQTLQAHHVVIGEMLAFQKEIVRSLNDSFGVNDIFEDETKLN
jgi:hypothetical protein